MRRLLLFFFAFLLFSGALTYLLTGSWIIVSVTVALISIVGVISYKVIDRIFPFEVFFHMNKRFKVDKSKSGTVLKDIVYKQGNNGDVKLDIYMPLIQKSTTIPVTIFVHGGAWLFGGRGDILKSHDAYEVMTRLREKGHAIISIDHQRLDKQTHFQDIISDCKDVIKWVRKIADEYGFNSDSIGIWGQSSGAYLALMTGLTDDTLFQGDQSLAQYSSKVKYIMDHYGPVDLTEFFVLNTEQKRPWFNNKIASMCFDVKPDKKDEFLRFSIECSPIRYVQKESPAILGFHGGKDAVIKHQQFQLLIDKSNQEGTRNHLRTIEGANHAFAGASEEAIESIINTTVEFALNHS